jgi:phosphonate transport system substrate-binding protein
MPATPNLTQTKVFSFLVLLLSILNAPFVLAQRKPVNFYLTPSLAEEVLDKNGTQLKNFLEKETGFSITLVIPATYDDMINKFGNGEASFGLMNSQSYVVANRKYGAMVKLRTIRSGHAMYYGMIITHVNTGIKNIKDLEGKTIAFTDELSASGYLFPKRLLDKKGIKPGKEMFLKKHDEVVRQVYEGKVPAGAAFYSAPSSDGVLNDARGRLKDKYPDIDKKVIILEKTEPIPNDPMVFSKNFSTDDARTLYTALVKLSTEPSGKQLLYELYGIEGFVKASDSDYNSLRSALQQDK